MAETTQQQLTDLYNQLSAFNGILSNLATLSSVNTMQGSLLAELNNLYTELGATNQMVQSMQTTISSILVDLRSQ